MAATHRFAAIITQARPDSSPRTTSDPRENRALRGPKQYVVAASPACQINSRRGQRTNANGARTPVRIWSVMPILVRSDPTPLEVVGSTASARTVPQLVSSPPEHHMAPAHNTLAVNGPHVVRRGVLSLRFQSPTSPPLARGLLILVAVGFRRRQSACPGSLPDLTESCGQADAPLDRIARTTMLSPLSAEVTMASTSAVPRSDGSSAWPHRVGSVHLGIDCERPLSGTQGFSINCFVREGNPFVMLGVRENAATVSWTVQAQNKTHLTSCKGVHEIL